MNKLSTALRNKKGFTLMEVIVVLIILAVLAAALIPTFLGFVNRANSSTAIAEARLGMTAAQAVLTDAVGRGLSGTQLDTVLTNMATGLAANDDRTRFNEFLGDEVPAGSSFSAFTRDGNRINGLLYRQGAEGTGAWFVRISANGTVTAQGSAPAVPGGGS